MKKTTIIIIFTTNTSELADYATQSSASVLLFHLPQLTRKKTERRVLLFDINLDKLANRKSFNAEGGVGKGGASCVGAIGATKQGSLRGEHKRKIKLAGSSGSGSGSGSFSWKQTAFY